VTERGTIRHIGVQVLPDGRLDRVNAARYLGRRPKTLAMWQVLGKGPRCVRDARGRCFYFLDDLDAFKEAGEAA